MATYYWCDECRKVYLAADITGGLCPKGHPDPQPVSRFGGLVKSFIATAGVEERSEAQTRHRQLIHALWAQNERDQQFYQLLTPGVSMGKFIKKVDDLHLRGTDEGWIRLILPTSPFAPASEYRLDYLEPERFIRELYTLFDLPVPETIEHDEADLASVSTQERSSSL